MIDTLVNRIEELAVEYPDKKAVIFREDYLTYSQLDRAVKRAGTILTSLGIRRGDRVLFTALSKPEMVVTYLGIQYAGGIAVFLDKGGTPESMAMIYEDTDAALILTDKPLKECVNKCRRESLRQFYHQCIGDEEMPVIPYERPGDEDMAELLFTTGTTGRPKGVILSYRAVYNILINTINGVGIRCDDKLLLPLPLNHSLALRLLRGTLYRGAALVLQNGFGFAKELEGNIKDHGCTGLATVPATMELLRMQMKDSFPKIMGKLTWIEVGAGSLTIKQRREITALLPHVRITNTWGSSETGGVLFTDVNAVVSDDQKIGCLGKPISGAEVLVLDSDDNPMPKSNKDHPGRLAIRGDMVMSGYYGRDDLTQKALQGRILLTNDLVYTDDDGYVYMLGRIDDIINVGGEKVSPVEVENIAGQYDGIRECACIGVPDPKKVLGQVPVLFMAVSSEYDERELKSFLTQRMERYKLPQSFVTVEELPRNAMKKIDRRAIRSLWESRGIERNEMNPVIKTILTRRSVRRFTDQDIPAEMLNLILQTGYHAPSGKNLQSWRFTVVQDSDKIEQLKKAAKEAARANKVRCYGFYNPKVLILVSNDADNEDGCQDASCAVENMLLSAHALGLGASWLNVLMTLRDAEPVKTILDSWGIPNNHIIWSSVALGYPAEQPKFLARNEEVVHYIGPVPAENPDENHRLRNI